MRRTVEGFWIAWCESSSVARSRSLMTMPLRRALTVCTCSVVSPCLWKGWFPCVGHPFTRSANRMRLSMFLCSNSVVTTSSDHIAFNVNHRPYNWFSHHHNHNFFWSSGCCEWQFTTTTIAPTQPQPPPPTMAIENTSPPFTLKLNTCGENDNGEVKVTLRALSVYI